MFFDRPDTGERALLVHCAFGGVAFSGVTNSEQQEGAANSKPATALPEVAEFVDLVTSAGVTPVYLEVARRARPTPNYFIGSGKVETVADLVRENGIEVVIFNHELSPSQERNLEKRFQCQVLDRTGLILDIFAQRARSHVGKLQVELAQLEHISTRLVRGWTHLERQKGGIGLRGPGESQLETDRRLLRERMKWLHKRLAKVRAQQQQSKRGRTRAEVPTIALVGYTNAGKSTLFNALTQANVYAQDQLFATLDTTLRAFELPGFGNVVFADTVGFVRELPHKLVEAFKATLEEAAEADVLLHVVDASSVDREEQIAACEAVLAEIGADHIPTIVVMNKIDSIEGLHPRLDMPSISEPRGAHCRVWVSAGEELGIPLLEEALRTRLGADLWQGEVTLAPGEARLRAELFAQGAVAAESTGPEGQIVLSLSYRREALERLFRENGSDFMACDTPG